MDGAEKGDFMTLIGKVTSAPIVGAAARGLWDVTRPLRLRMAGFRSAAYWDSRYARGGSSGAGSYGDLAQFKSRVLNAFVAEQNVKSVIEFGCGDGNQLALARYPEYIGYDVSANAIKRCRDAFDGDRTKKFGVLDENYRWSEQAELALSLDVIYHLVEDDVFEKHMKVLFQAASRFVIIYSDDQDLPRRYAHVRHRRFSSWVQQHVPDWRLVQHIPNEFPHGPNRRPWFVGGFFDLHRDAGGKL